MQPKYNLEDYVFLNYKDGKDDEGRPIKTHTRDGSYLGRIKAVYKKDDRFIYSIDGWYMIFEENLQIYYQPPSKPPLRDVVVKVNEEIVRLERIIQEKNEEIDRLKAGERSNELKEALKTMEDMTKSLVLYANASNWKNGEIQNDYNNDDCSGYFRTYGGCARSGLYSYELFCKKFNHVMIKREW